VLDVLPDVLRWLPYGRPDDCGRSEYLTCGRLADRSAMPPGRDWSGAMP